VAITIGSVAGFYTWRRAPMPWRAIAFAAFVVCTLLLIDVFAVGVTAPPPPTASTSTQACP